MSIAEATLDNGEESKQRYHQAEEKLWAHAGVTPTTQRVHLDSTGVPVRIQEVGDGPPVLFLHPAGPNAGVSWALLAARLRDRRCILVDLPGYGLSEPLLLDTADMKAFGDRIAAEILDALAIDHADLIGGSVGGWMGLRSAATNPDRIGRLVQLGCPPFLQGGTVPLMMRLSMLPGLWRLLRKLPSTERDLRMVYQTMGNGQSLESNRIPQAMWEWQLAFGQETDYWHNELTQFVALRSVRHGFDPALTLDRQLLGSIRRPYYFLADPDDPFGNSDVTEQLVADLPNAELELVPDVGHWPWLHAPDFAASMVQRFLDGHE